MLKQIIIYNLAENVTDEQFKDYVLKEKGALMKSFPGVENYELFKVVRSESGKIPYKYVGIMHIKNMDEFVQKAVPSQKFQDFLKKWQPMTSEAYVLTAEKIY